MTRKRSIARRSLRPIESGRRPVLELDVEDQLGEIGALFDARALHRVTHAPHWTERCIEQNAADRAATFRLQARSRGLITAALLDLDFHLELAAGGEMRNHVLGIDDL